MQFKKVNFESMRLGDDARVSKTYTRQVEEDSRLTQFIGSESEETTGKDFLATALENCQKFNEEFEGTFDK